MKKQWELGREQEMRQEMQILGPRVWSSEQEWRLRQGRRRRQQQWQQQW